MENLQVRKAKVIEAVYDDQQGYISCEIEFLNKRKATLMWLREEFAATFNLSEDVEDKLIHNFCKILKDKYINLAHPGVKHD